GIGKGEGPSLPAPDFFYSSWLTPNFSNYCVCGYFRRHYYSSLPMIFGFNTDIKHDDVVYHVQSEAREGETLLQTQVFVKGRCIGKHAISYAERAASQGFTDQQKELMLREQHRQVLDAIREGRLEEDFDTRDNPEALGAIKELDIQWVNSHSIHAEEQLSMKLRATESGQPVPGARLTVRFARI